MIPYRPQKVFFKAFQNALNIAKQNDATITVVKVVSYPMGLGLDVMTAVDAVSREYEMHKFEQIMSELQKEALAAEIKLDFQVIDLRLSPAKAFVEFASKNDVDLMVIGSISERAWAQILYIRHFTGDNGPESPMQCDFGGIMACLNLGLRVPMFIIFFTFFLQSQFPT